MAQSHKNLGLSRPSAATNTTLYTAPTMPSTTTLVSSIHICNTATTNDKVRVFIVPNGSSAGISNAAIYDLIIPPGNPFIMNTLPTMDAGDFISVYSLNGTSTFNASGLEIT